MAKKIVPIKYTSRNFDDIKNDLVNYTKKYYPDTYQDFNVGSFGSLMLDTVSYVGDIMSFYLDYQANESFLETAIEYNNILKLGAGLGYKPKVATSANGIVALYISIPASTTAADFDHNYLPIIKQGSVFQSTNGNTYTLTEDVAVTPETATVVRSRVGITGPFEYVAKTYGKVVSGVQEQITVALGDFIKFRKVLVGDETVTEIISVVDSNGNIFYEVDYLTQNIIYRSVPNHNTDYKATPYVLKPMAVARRFIVIREKNETYIQFGAAEDDVVNMTKNKIADPSNIIMNLYGKDYITDESFDPMLLVNGDKLGAAPYNTDLIITYRRNQNLQTSTPVNSINSVINPIVDFMTNNSNIDVSTRVAIRDSLTVSNEQPIIGSSGTDNIDDLRVKIYGAAALQNRAVTVDDYKSICYLMPSRFGTVKRAAAFRDVSPLKRNINLYTISENSDGTLVNTNQTTKENLKTWISKNKVINDSIDIIDAKIVNFGIDFIAIADQNYSKYTVLASALNAIAQEFSIKMDIGESIQMSRIYEALRRVDGLLDVRTIKLTQKDSSISKDYSESTFSFEENMTDDGMFLRIPKNVIMEIKFPDLDIEGKIL